MEKTWIFFYGTFMSAQVLRQHGIDCPETYAARLSGYALSIRPRVNLTPSPESWTYGGLAFISHGEIASLYEDLKQQFGIVYHPYPVVAELSDQTMRAALCFISPNIPDAAPDGSYVDELSKCAEEMGAPKSYIDHIQSFQIFNPLK
ncbi:hypothetical protein XM38_035430 [Halomicronema hongdechloris C2206]|uniref:Gamma-glutamylcyclotransferase AIG2-like domain-containing protein n=1 Tax=Halomicronema hongdechloris C2206 TaxID=1641165 RepID=A0A1Z3HQM1_9CYAN|nr:gamma-glutamylcyclotransferase family protein [Halomicronema hongdechloris]ASC72585.1 hypothetical protein XM38_035430 [Halomicronema hongdechloris C2206]